MRDLREVELGGLEPPTSCMPCTQRAVTSWCVSRRGVSRSSTRPDDPARRRPVAPTGRAPSVASVLASMWRSRQPRRSRREQKQRLARAPHIRPHARGRSASSRVHRVHELRPDISAPLARAVAFPRVPRSVSARRSRPRARIRRPALLRHRSPDHRRSRRPRARPPATSRRGESGDVHAVADLFGSLPAGSHAGRLFLSAEGAVQGGMLEFRAIALTSNPAMTLRPSQVRQRHARRARRREGARPDRDRDPYTVALLTRAGAASHDRRTGAAVQPLNLRTRPDVDEPRFVLGAAARTDGHPARCDTARAALSSRCASTSTRAPEPEATTFSRNTGRPALAPPPIEVPA